MEGLRTVSSAPGKVLLTGGYLVLQQPFSGLVLSLSSRFQTSIESGSTAADSLSNVLLVVRSPQFDTVVTYCIDLASGTIASDGDYNPYVANALLWSVLFAAQSVSVQGLSLDITVQGGNDFYSQLDALKERNLPLTSASLASLPPFMRVGSDMSAMRKTGLGSSAALVTSLVAGLCSHLKIAECDKLEIIHKLAQFVHCLAQGKIGSGFDVSSAVFGSQLYSRFSPSLLDSLLRDAEEKSLTGQILYKSLCEEKWDGEHIPLALPKGMRLILGDVSQGSNTPQMVGKVLSWKKENLIDSENLWNRINVQNGIVKSSLAALNFISRDEMENCAQVPSEEWSRLPNHEKSGELLSKCRNAFLEARKGLAEMGKLANVSIEPSEQTELCDCTMQELGVLAAGVPGAGGFDAIFALVLTDEAAQRVETLWGTWKTQVLPMVVREDPRGVIVDQKE